MIESISPTSTGSGCYLVGFLLTFLLTPASRTPTEMFECDSNPMALWWPRD